MRIDVLNVPKNQLLVEAYPELAMIEEWIYTADDELLRYIVLLYSPDSVLNTKPVTPLPERKIKAAHMIGIKSKKKIASLNDLEDYAIVESIFAFLRFMDPHEMVWREIVTTEQEITDYQKARTQSLQMDSDKDKFATMEKRSKFMLEIDKRIARLDRLYGEFFGDHEDVQEISLKRFSFGKNTLESRAIENRGYVL